MSSASNASKCMCKSTHYGSTDANGETLCSTTRYCSQELLRHEQPTESLAIEGGSVAETNDKQLYMCKTICQRCLIGRFTDAVRSALSSHKQGLAGTAGEVRLAHFVSADWDDEPDFGYRMILSLKRGKMPIDKGHQANRLGVSEPTEDPRPGAQHKKSRSSTSTEQPKTKKSHKARMMGVWSLCVGSDDMTSDVYGSAYGALMTSEDNKKALNSQPTETRDDGYALPIRHVAIRSDGTFSLFFDDLGPESDTPPDAEAIARFEKLLGTDKDVQLTWSPSTILAQ